MGSRFPSGFNLEHQPTRGPFHKAKPAPTRLGLVAGYASGSFMAVFPYYLSVGELFS